MKKLLILGGVLITTALIIKNPYIIVIGNSMAPTLHNFSILKLTPATNLKDGDIIVFHHDSEILIKRIVYNGANDNIVYDSEYSSFAPAQLKAFLKLHNAGFKYCSNQFHHLSVDEYWIDGDNTNATISSSMIGPINDNDIIGKIPNKK